MKTLFLDCETTGVDPARHGLVQLSMILDIDGVTVDEGNYMMRPFLEDIIDFQALLIQGRGTQEILQLPEPRFTHRLIVDFLSEHIDRYDKTDKAVPVAYNGHFDMAFLSRFFEKCDDKFLGSYIYRYHVDPLNIINTLSAFRNYFPSLENRKLLTVCRYFGIELTKAHDAMSDTRAMRELTYYLVDMLTGIIRPSEGWSQGFEDFCAYMRV